jgi:hypothetical protein
MRGTGLLRSRRRIGEKEPMPKLWTSYGLFLLLLVVAVLSQRTAGAVGQTGSVVVAEYDGIVHPIAAEYIDDMIARAERADAVAAIVILRTPGGLLDSTRTIITRIIEARRPVVVFIAPSGSGETASAASVPSSRSRRIRPATKKNVVIWRLMIRMAGTKAAELARTASGRDSKRLPIIAIRNALAQ